jgi:hypothetical protein
MEGKYLNVSYVNVEVKNGGLISLSPYVLMMWHIIYHIADGSRVSRQVLGIMTLLLITSQSKERPFVLLHSQAIFSHSTAGHTSSQVTSVELSPSK